MARKVERHPERIPKLERTAERDTKLRQWLSFEIEAALSARHRLEAVWREARRQYAGMPRLPVRTNPIPNAPNIEIPVGAIAADSIYSAAIDALFTASPLLIVRGTEPKWREHAKAMQVWVNWMAEHELELRRAVENTFLDNTQLGTAAYYVPYSETKRKTDIHRTIQSGPRMVAVAPEDLILPGTARDSIHDSRWAGIRFYYTPVEVRDRAKHNPSWDISKAMPVATVNLVRAQREEFANVRSGLTVKEQFEFIDIYAYFDYDEDGEDEDLLITWDRSSNSLISVTFNPYDKRPLEKMVYQARAHAPYGMGVMEMIQPFQEEASELHNYKILNSMLANARLYISEVGNGVDESQEFWPSMVLQVNDITKFQALAMADTTANLSVFEESGMRLAEQRVGLRGELSLLAKGGSRTPATTSLALLQQTNRRFTPSFDQMRLTSAAAVRQAVLRYSERAKLGDKTVRKHFKQVLGEDAAELVWEVLRRPDFEESVFITFTASSATVSRETDRQNALLLMNTMDQQHQRIAELVQIAANPETPEPLRRAVIKMIEAKNEMFDKLLRTFELVRDPGLFVADVIPELEEANEQAAGEEQAAVDGEAAIMESLLVPQAVPGPEEPLGGGPPGILS
jgi:hypothetical protein